MTGAREAFDFAAGTRRRARSQEYAARPGAGVIILTTPINSE
jgi:hypothetical protein